MRDCKQWCAICPLGGLQACVVCCVLCVVCCVLCVVCCGWCVVCGVFWVVFGVWGVVCCVLCVVCCRGFCLVCVTLCVVWLRPPHAPHHAPCPPRHGDELWRGI